MEVKQRVNGLVIKILYKIYKLFGYDRVYFSLYFVVLYYFLFASNVRQALKIYYKKLGIKFSNKNFYKHLFNYAVTTSDRFISKADPQLYSFEYSNRPHLIDEIKQGSILLLHHFGGWATASKCFKEDDVVVNIVMSEAMIAGSAAFEEILEKKNADSTHIINLSKGNIAATLDIAHALTHNESVAMMGDRALDKKYSKAMNFFEEPAAFNENPFLIAYKTKKSLVPFIVVLLEKKKYQIKFETIKFDYSLSQSEAIEGAMKQYVAFVSQEVKANPYQWFNFYDFWSLSNLNQT